MKIGTDNGVFRERLDEERSLKLLADAGFDCVDYGLLDFSGYTAPWVKADDYLKRAEVTAGYLRRFKLECPQTHAPYKFPYGGVLDESNPDFSGLVRSLEYSAVIGAKCCVIHGVTVPTGIDLMEYNLEFFRSLVPAARKSGVRIAVENLYMKDPYRDCLIGKFADPAAMTALLNELPEDCFTCCLDTGHAAMCGVEPDDFVRKMPPGAITALHVHDNDRARDMHQLPYLCDLRWPEFMNALKDYGYSGVFSMELVRYYLNLPVSLYPSALRFAADTARQLLEL